MQMFKTAPSGITASPLPYLSLIKGVAITLHMYQHFFEEISLGILFKKPVDAFEKRFSLSKRLTKICNGQLPTSFLPQKWIQMQGIVFDDSKAATKVLVHMLQNNC